MVALLCFSTSWLLLHGLADEIGREPETRAAKLTQTQIESDWLRQNELREGEAAAAASGASRNARDGKGVKLEEDARGGVDGVIDGKWGFHTENEDKPWWQVDLGEVKSLEKIVLYNRCDAPAMAGRNSRIMVLVSEGEKDGKDGKDRKDSKDRKEGENLKESKDSRDNKAAGEFKQAYQNEGVVFGGFGDKKPLVAALGGVKARFVRLQLPGRSYFHLDEVEIYAVGETRNIALGKPATQSSVSQWSVAHSAAAPASAGAAAAASSTPRKYATAKAIERGIRLADNLRQAGTQVDREAQALRQAEDRLKKMAANAPDEEQRALYFEARGAARSMALKNPLLDFDSILFVKSAPSLFPHMSDQFYGWWSRPGGGVFILENFKSDHPTLRHLTKDMPDGNFLRPDLSYDGRKILFAACKYYPEVANIKDKATKANLPEDAFYHIYEMNLDGSGRRQVTRGRYDDFDARYLPSGEIVFLSTRKGVFIQCDRANSEATRGGDLPDSYVRCGGDNYRPVPVFTMHVMDANGENMRPLSAFENFEWTPAVANDGRILFTRWDYIDRFNGHFFSLWSANQDGTNAQLVYKNYTIRPQVACEAQSIPNSSKVIFTASAHHSILGGSLVMLDRMRGTEAAEPITRLTPEVPFPETEKNVDSYYANPWPLSEEHYLVAWSDRHLPPHCRVDDTERNPTNAAGIYLYDAFGNLNLLYRDPAISCGNPIPVRPRQKPMARASTIAWEGAGATSEGCFLVQDVYQGLPETARGTIKWLRVVGVPPKVQPHMNKPNLGVSSEDPGKFLLGLAPVESDGSAFFRVPSGVSILFQSVDENKQAVQTMRSLTYVWPGQTLGCVGCHETREAAPPPLAKAPQAARRAPSKLIPGPEGSWPLRYDQLVQPILDKNCVSCHKPGGREANAARFDLSTAAKSYDALINWSNKDLRLLTFERDRSIAGDCPARKSKLWAKIAEMERKGAFTLDAAARDRLSTWMDLYAQRQGHFSDEQERQLQDFKQRLAAMLED
ncbi:MAG: discoidin domain-containing protein [Candidatus Sumerlaeota bacterium]|nr:discoidin domain-containing protein [Candidatus Sumerlaeota bacterium]